MANEALTINLRCLSNSFNVNVIQGRRNANVRKGGGDMSDQVFQDAYSRVRARFSDQEWFGMTPRQITDAIYREIRVIDQERLSTVDQSALPVAAE